MNRKQVYYYFYYYLDTFVSLYNLFTNNYRYEQ